jgi:hypothetical protein
MSEDPKNPDEPAALEEEEARAFILSRRARFVAAAMAGVGLVASCGGTTSDTSNPNPCLGGTVTGGMSGTGNLSTGGTPQPCLSMVYPGSGGVAPFGGTTSQGGAPQPCLSGGAFGSGGIPQPCLEPPAPSGGGYFGSGGISGSGGMPQVCLGMAATGGAPPETDAGADATANGGSAGAGGTGGAGGIPQPCLSIPQLNDVRKK